ncbi:predicted protein [Uncinocarpus reesii 1704]|uniref:DNL-type domain-containing protein n=1 Tax=Uncinocarpus reesii (strain UAMH 1704) TaxID=336963 RepID=C4JFZ3_UNCRE|nr:uncharacterized protein UREG_01073 [Uncinocarpus reesii 1704]EEP76224.1 predicted protein [Uncinocarpus reesii 1704]
MAAPKRLFRNVASLSCRSHEAGLFLRARRSAVNPFSTLSYQSRYSPERQASIRLAPFHCRHNSTSTKPPKPLTDSKPATPEEEAYNEARRAEEPSYLITFTCKPCSHRSGHRISKHGYHKGTVLIMCPNCRNKHVISDHLNIFMDTKSTLEDILAKQGQTLKKVTLGEGDLELWPEASAAAEAEGSQGSEKP